MIFKTEYIYPYLAQQAPGRKAPQPNREEPEPDREQPGPSRRKTDDPDKKKRKKPEYEITC